MRVLVTGAAGFIGSNLCDRLLANGNTVYGLDNFNDYYVKEGGPQYADRKQQNIASALAHPNYRLITADVSEPLTLTEPIDAVVHLAARAGVRASKKDPGSYYIANIGGTMHVLEWARKHKVQQCIIASSSSVYGNTPTGNTGWTEGTPLGPSTSPYAESKKLAEAFCHVFQHNYHGQPCISIIRPFTIYGPRGRVDMFPDKLLRAIHHGNSVDLNVRADGQVMLRDFTYIDDFVDGIVAALEHRFPFEIFNLGNNHPVALPDVIRIASEVVGKEAIVQEKPAPAEDVIATFADVTRARRLLGWKPKTDLKTGLTKFYNWLKTHDPTFNKP